MICVAYDCFLLPPRIAFGNDILGPLFVIDIIMDFIFLLDVVVNLQTGACLELRLALVDNIHANIFNLCFGFFSDILAVWLALLNLVQSSISSRQWLSSIYINVLTITRPYRALIP